MIILPTDYVFPKQIAPVVKKLSSFNSEELEDQNLTTEILNLNSDTIYKIFNNYDNCSEELQNFCLQINDDFLKQQPNFKTFIETKFIETPEYLLYEIYQTNPIIQLYVNKYLDYSLYNTDFKNKLDDSIEGVLKTNHSHNFYNNQVYKQYFDEQIKNFLNHYSSSQNYDTKEYRTMKTLFNNFIFHNLNSLGDLLDKYERFIPIFKKTDLLNNLFKNEDTLTNLIVMPNLLIAGILRSEAKNEISNLLESPTFEYKSIANDLIGANRNYDNYLFIIKDINTEKNINREIYQIKHDSVYKQQSIIAIVLGDNLDKKEKLLQILYKKMFFSCGNSEPVTNFNNANIYLHHLIQNPNFVQALITNPTAITDREEFRIVMRQNTQFFVNPHFKYFSPQLELLLKKTVTNDIEVCIFDSNLRGFNRFEMMLSSGIVNNHHFMEYIKKDSIDLRFMSFIEKLYATRIYRQGYNAIQDDSKLTNKELQNATQKETYQEKEYGSLHNRRNLSNFMLKDCKNKETQLVDFFLANNENLENLAGYSYFIEMLDYKRGFDGLLMNIESLNTLIKTNPTDTYLLLDRIKNSTNNVEISNKSEEQQYLHIMFMETETRNNILANTQEILFNLENDELLSTNQENVRAVGFSNIFQICLDELYKTDKERLKAFISTASKNQKEQINLFISTHPTYDKYILSLK